MAKKILVHGSGHKAASWKETVSCMDGKEELLCPDLCALLAGKNVVTSNKELVSEKGCEPLWGVCRIL